MRFGIDDDAVGSDVVKAAHSMKAAITPDMLIQWTNSSPPGLANETFAIAKAVATRYCVMPCDRTGKGLAITTGYRESNKLVGREQLQKAAVRLARILDTAL